MYVLFIAGCRDSGYIRAFGFTVRETLIIIIQYSICLYADV